MNQIISCSPTWYGVSHCRAHYSPVRRSRLSQIFTAVLLVVVSLLAARSVAAQGRAGTLGGPIVGGSSSADGRTARPRDEKRLAQAGGELAATPSTEETVATPPQSPLPVDLAAVRSLKVVNKLIDEAPLRVGNLDLLAPIVPNLQLLGASASRASASSIPGSTNVPSQDQIFQINLPQGAPVVLIVGNSTAYIDGKEQQLRAAPLVIKGKIWLPIFSLAPLMGAAIRLDPDGTLYLTPTVQSVELFPVKGILALTVKTSAPLQAGSVGMGTLDNPPRIYLDFPGYAMGLDAANSTAERVVSDGLGEVRRVRIGLSQAFPVTTRVVLDLKRKMKGVPQPLPDKTLYALMVVPPNGYVVVRQAPQPPLPGGTLRGLTIVVDAGHGGHDSGARGSRSFEKQHTLDIARRLRNHLVDRGATVLMTRDGDYFIPLQGRVDFANSRGADLFVSVHINALRKTSTGTETYFWTAQSLALAREVHKELVQATGLKSRGVFQRRFFVIRKTWMPSILTESAFISNPAEEKRMMDPQWRERVAGGIAQGITNYVTVYMRPGATSS